jgi:hypothetical protein
MEPPALSNRQLTLVIDSHRIGTGCASPLEFLAHRGQVPKSTVQTSP